MAFEGMLAKLGPTLVREATPHVVQMLAGLGERFRRDTRELKESMDAEIASMARTHAGLVTSVEDQRTRLQTLQEQLTVVDRKVELLHKSVDTFTRQLASGIDQAAALQRSVRNLALAATILSALACSAAVAALILHR